MKKRWAIKLALYLLASAVITFAAAAGLSWRGRSQSEGPYTEFRREDGSLWRLIDGGLWYEGVSIHDVDRRRIRILPSWGDRFPLRDPPGWFDRCGAGRLEALGVRTDSYEVVAFGWPLRSLAKTTDRTLVNPKQPSIATELLPLGFTLNTLLAAAVMLTLTEGAGAWRRRARRSKGKCPWCGYDRAGVAGDAACPECGRVA